MGELFDRTAPTVKLDWTGERLTDGAGRQVEIEHLHRYFLARSLCRGLDVLDVASGEGYGSALLSQTARSVVGVELDAASVAHARTSYVKSNLRFMEGDARDLPLPDACVDVVVSFETIEHFYHHDRFIAEVRRVLRPGGRFLVSSPERNAYSPAGFDANPYHVRELTRAEFVALLQGNFAHVIVQAQRNLLGSALVTDTLKAPCTAGVPLTFERRGSNRFEVSDYLPGAMYLIAVASDKAIDNIPDSLYIEHSNVEQALVDLPAVRNELARTVTAHNEAANYARHLESEIAARDQNLATEVATRDMRLSESGDALLAAQTERDALKAAIDEVMLAADRVTEERDLLVGHLEDARNLADAERQQSTALAVELAEARTQANTSITHRDRAVANYEQALILAQKYRGERDVLASRLADANADALQADLRIRHLDTALARTKVELDQAQNAANDATRLAAALGESESACLQMQAQALSLGEQLVQLAAECTALRAEHDRLLNSSVWRMSWPLRAMLDRHPSVRRMLRSGAKLAWWTATLQLRRRIISRRRSPPALEVFTNIATPADLPSADQPPTAQALPLFDMDEKSRLTDSMRAELNGFLASDDRLSFSSAVSPDISVLVILWNQAHLTLHALRMLQAQQGASIELILVDNASTDETGLVLQRLDGVRIICNTQNQGFVLSCNQGAALARGQALLLLNSDAFVRPGALSAALATLRSAPDIGAVGGRLILPTGRLQEAGSIVWSDGSSLGYGRGLAPCASEAMFRREVDYCSGAFLLTPLALWNRLGGFDAAYAPAYYEEADYCMRLWAANYRVVYEPAAVVDHYEFGSEAKQGDAATTSLGNRELFKTRHVEALAQSHLSPAEANILAARSRFLPNRRRLLMIDNDVPLGALGSGYPRAREMLIAAVKLGWHVTLFPLHRLEIDWDAARAEIPWEVEIVADSGAAGLADFLVRRHLYYDVMLVSRPENMSFVRGILRQNPRALEGARLVYDAEALVAPRDIARALMDGELLTESHSGAHLIAELALADKADAVVCVNDMEAAAFRTHGATVHVLGHVTSCAADPPGFASRDGFLFVGRLLEKHAPNWNGLLWFLHHVWPLIRVSLPNAHIYVVGHLHPEHAELHYPGVRLVGPVANLAPVYDAARVFVAPVRFAAGIPIKILEAAAAGIPVAATRLMARQLGWERDVEIVAEDTPDAFAQAALALHQNADKWAAMRASAQTKVAGEYGGMRFLAGMRALLEGEAPPGPVADAGATD